MLLCFGPRPAGAGAVGLASVLFFRRPTGDESRFPPPPSPPPPPPYCMRGFLVAHLDVGRMQGYDEAADAGLDGIYHRQSDGSDAEEVLMDNDGEGEEGDERGEDDGEGENLEEKERADGEDVDDVSGDCRPCRVWITRPAAASVDPKYRLGDDSRGIGRCFVPLCRHRQTKCSVKDRHNCDRWGSGCSSLQCPPGPINSSANSHRIAYGGETPTLGSIALL